MPTVAGHAELNSSWFSNRWTLTQGDRELADVVRLGRLYVSAVDMPGVGRFHIEPHGDGVVRMVDDGDNELARIRRLSWVGRRWEIDSLGYTYELNSDPRPRRWHIAIANAPLATLEGSMISYNHVRIDAGLAMPVTAVLLAWHVIARPWEAAAEPRGLIPASRRQETRPASGPRPSPPVP
jgi:hypothetical protein